MDALQSLTVGIGVHPRTGLPDVGSQRAARQAAWIGQQTGAHVTLLHASWAEDSSASMDMHERTIDELDELAMLIAADGVSVEVEVTHEYPWLALVKRGVQGRTDMILAGKRATLDRGRRLVGSTSVNLVRKCPVPVWLVKPDHDLRHQHVLTALDLSPISETVLSAAAWIASSSGGELHVLHAWNLRPDEQRRTAELSEGEYTELVESRRAQRQADLEREVDGLSIDPTLHLQRGAAHVEILKEVEEEHPDLLVMGSLSRGGRPGFEVGTTAERVLAQVDESLLTFKPKDFVCPIE